MKVFIQCYFTRILTPLELICHNSFTKYSPIINIILLYKIKISLPVCYDFIKLKFGSETQNAIVIKISILQLKFNLFEKSCFYFSWFIATNNHTHTFRQK